MKHVFTLNILLRVLTVSLVLSGCDARIGDSPYQVIDTGYWSAEVNLLAEPSWLDNERIIFTSSDTLKPEKPPYRVKVLNTTTGQIVSTNLSSFICVRNGQVFYGVKDDGTDTVTYYRGPLENAKEHPAPGPDMVMDEQYECDWIQRGPPDRLHYHSKLLGKNSVEIIEERRRLDEYQMRPKQRERARKAGEDRGPEGKVLYHRDENDSGRLLPSGSVSYSEYLDAYVVGHGYYDPQWPETRSFWILARNGNLKEIPYPKTTLVGRNDLFPVKPGYLVHYNGGPLTEKEGTRGLYLIQATKCRDLLWVLLKGFTFHLMAVKQLLRMQETRMKHFGNQNLKQQ